MRLSQPLTLALVIALTCACHATETSSKPSSDGVLLAGTETGNPPKPAKTFVARSFSEQICSMLSSCYGADVAECQTGVGALSGMDVKLGLPANSFPAFSSLIGAENAGDILAFTQASSPCLEAVYLLGCSDPKVRAAYDPMSVGNKFAGVADLVPSAASCPNVFSLRVTPETGMVGQGQSVDLVISGGMAPYHVSILPGGVGGTATVTGAVLTYKASTSTGVVSIQVTDSAGNSVQATVSVTSTGIRRVQSAGSSQNPFVSPHAATAIAPTQAGNLLVVVTTSSRAGQPVLVTDDMGQTYTLAAAHLDGAAAAQVWYRANTRAGATSVIATYGDNGNATAIIVAEYSGLPANVSADQTSVSHHCPSCGPYWSSGATAMTGAPDELLIGGVTAFSQTAVITPGTGWIPVRTQISETMGYMQEQVVGATGAFSASGGIDLPVNVVSAIVTFR